MMNDWFESARSLQIPLLKFGSKLDKDAWLKMERLRTKIDFCWKESRFRAWLRQSSLEKTIMLLKSTRHRKVLEITQCLRKISFSENNLLCQAMTLSKFSISEYLDALKAVQALLNCGNEE